MAPKVARAAVEQTPQEKETHPPTTKPHTNGKQRQTASGGAAHATKASSVAADKTSSPPNGLDANAHMWSSFDRDILHSYRRQYRLDTPTTISNSYHHRILSGGVGKHSPTMAHRSRAAGPTRQTKEQLELAIRRHFTSLSVVENDVVVNFIHKVRQDDAEATRRRLARRGGEHA